MNALKQRLMLKSVLFAGAFVFTTHAFAMDKANTKADAKKRNATTEVSKSGDIGYWFYKDTQKREEFLKKNKRNCEKDWNKYCPFRAPKNWKEQEKMRDTLLQQAYMHPDDQWSVEQLQKYIGWIVSQSLKAVSTWKFNQLQNGSDSSFRFNVKVAREIFSKNLDEVFEIIKSLDGKIIFFSREGCIFCERARPIVKRIKKKYAVDIMEVSVLSKCKESVEWKCVDGKRADELASRLKIYRVPSYYLYFADNGVWIKIGEGLSSEERLTDNTRKFFLSWRARILGIAKGSVLKDKNGNTFDKGILEKISKDPEYEHKLIEVLKRGEKMN